MQRSNHPAERLLTSLLLVGSSAINFVYGSPELSAQENARQQYALLVGCTEYLNEHVDTLYGPQNDVTCYYDLLTDKRNGFGFPENHVTRLVGWPKNPEQRPTYANITAAFEQLLNQAEPQTQVFILLSGHGVQVPAPENRALLDADTPEPDGLDELFLPADVMSWKEPDGLRNAIRDDQIGEWLEALRAKGANVWIVFDCCHANTMSRGAHTLERARTVPPKELGIPAIAVDPTRQRTHQLHSTHSLSIDSSAIPPQRHPDASAMGSIVAFYASQSWETAPELPRPEDAVPDADNYYGLLSYTLAECLHQRHAPMSYRDLSRELVARYRAECRRDLPTPAFEGDLDREVLGSQIRPAREIVIERKNNSLVLSAGELQGLTVGSLLAVHSLAADTRASTTVLGYVEVARVTPLSAEVIPRAFEDYSRIAPQAIPEGAKCELVSRSFGDLAIKIALLPKRESCDPALEAPLNNLVIALEQLGNKVTPLVEFVPLSGSAEWGLQLVSPLQAEEWYGLKLDKPMVLLLQVDDIETGEGSAERKPRSLDISTSRKVLGQYPSDSVDELVACLERDIPKIFRWQNIWRIAGKMPAPQDNENGGLVFEVVKLEGPEDDSAGQVLEENYLSAGQTLEYRFVNDSDDDLWVSAFFLDANFGIHLLRSGSVHTGCEWTPIRGTITDTSLGTEGVVVFAAPLSVNQSEPNLAFLQQSPLGISDSMKRFIRLTPATPFEQLMQSATTHYWTRGVHLTSAPSNPIVLSRSWITVPLESPHSE